MEGVGPIVQLIESGGTVALLVLFGFAVHKRFFVLGREYDECDKQRLAYKALLDKHADKLEARLDKYESEREQPRGSPPS